ncbi:MAG: heme-binding protein [Bryobacterales bacterium]|nr:heme-binding protein [Bryobacterales bacterium]MBV9398385.1 heme-binding protein [Bryobacterales bacterium]
MIRTKYLLLAGAVALVSTSAFAQLPSSKVLTLDVAQAIAQETLAKCRADGYKVTVLVVDGLNAPKAMVRDDGASASTTEVAKMKATATMLYNRPSGPAQPLPAGQTAPPATIPGTINAQGGVPIKVGDVTIGAVAVSGAPGGDKDAACASAALAKLADRLK